MSNSQYAMAAYHMAMRTVPPLQAVVMLYDGILLRLASAAEAQTQCDHETQYDSIASAIRIMEGLNRSLDMQAGGQVAMHYRDMYKALSIVLRRTVGQPNAAQVYRRLEAALRNTRNAWAEIAGMAPSRGMHADPAVPRVSRR